MSETIHDVKRVALERHDKVKVGPHAHTLTFAFTNYGALDGVDFSAGCSRTVKVTVRIGKIAASPSQVFLGKDRTGPTSVPFTIERAHGSTPARVA